MADLFPPRHGPRHPDDHTLGCGQPPSGVTNGRVCAGTGGQLSCQLCPNSPTYWRNTSQPRHDEGDQRARPTI